MAHSHPICVLKVDDSVTHCKGCVKNVKKLLSKIDGVEDVEVDEEKGTVTVYGEADPQVILEAIRKKNKKAEMLSYEDPRKEKVHTKEPKIDMRSNKSDKGKKKEEPEHVFEAYVPKSTKCKDPFCKAHQGGFTIKSNENLSHVYYPPPHMGFPPPVSSNTYYEPMYPPHRQYDPYQPMFPSGYYGQSRPGSFQNLPPRQYDPYQTMYSRGYNEQSWPQRDGNLPRSLRFDRQLPHPQFDPCMSQRAPRQGPFPSCDWN